ncbi:MAG: peptidase M64 [Muribaculaceae bacterium]|nr:peptidase M64 [Muribaculaceae bacterium]
MKKRFSITMILSLSGLCLMTGAPKENFEDIFNDSTLRVDYVFSGIDGDVSPSLTSESKQPGWYGRRTRLKDTPAKGNGTVLMLDPATGDTLYVNSFSTLFQEWLVTPEAFETPRSFENSFLLPLPKKETVIKIELRNNRHKDISTLSYLYKPDNELVARRGASPRPHQYLHKGGDPKDVIDIAILSEGYTEAEMDSFINHSQKIVNEILSYEPFASKKDKFNFVAVPVPSRDSGVSIPVKDEWKETAFGSHFSTFHSPRYLTVPKVKAMHEALEGIPYEHLFVVVNTPEYGGGGIFNSYQVAAAKNRFTLPVAVHEFGHSFAGLADEYFYADEEDDTYPLDVEPWEANITTMVDFDSKWADIADGEKVGVFQGGGYKTLGIFRPTETCRMRDNFFPTFCPVCEKEILKIINFYTEQ